MLSDGGVHSHIEHLFGIIKMAKARGLDNIYIHLFLDGRDTPPHSGAGYIKELKDFIEKEQFGVIASVMGRYYAMDRDNRWERVAQAYDALIGEGAAISDALEYVRQSYNKNETDEFVRPATVFAQGAPVGAIQKGDSVLFFNFRPDRARELTRAFIYDDFDKFARKTGYLDVLYAGMTEYDAEFTNILTAFPPEDLTNTLGEVLAARGIPQLRIAETEKYALLPFSLTGGVEAQSGRTVPSFAQNSTYDLKRK